MQRDMEYIRMVYKTGSFSKAAELLFSSQPTVSMAVQRVEEELGAKLFERGTSPLRPTEAMGELSEHFLSACFLAGFQRGPRKPGWCSTPAGAVLTAPRLPRVPGAPAAPRQAGRLYTLLAYSLLLFQHCPEQ